MSHRSLEEKAELMKAQVRQRVIDALKSRTAPPSKQNKANPPMRPSTDAFQATGEYRLHNTENVRDIVPIALSDTRTRLESLALRPLLLDQRLLEVEQRD